MNPQFRRAAGILLAVLPVTIFVSSGLRRRRNKWNTRLYGLRHALGADKVAATALGSSAIGALAVGALAIGALAIGRVAIRDSRLRSLQIDELTVGRLRINELVGTDALTAPDRGSKVEDLSRSTPS
jgi:hypothetical protein